MTKQQRLIEIEKFWKSEPRDQQWADIQWNPYVYQSGIDVKTEGEAKRSLQERGYAFWTMGDYEWNNQENFCWESALLDWLHFWYSLPEDCNTPLFINELAWAVCIPHTALHHFVHLFPKQHSALLGMEHWENSKNTKPSPNVAPDRLTPARAFDLLVNTEASQ